MKRSFFLSLIVAAFTASSAWIARGLFDELVRDEGVFHVVNATAEEHIIELRFPSGVELGQRVAAGSSMDLRVNETGEGAIEVRVDGVSRGPVGYVTSLNGVSVVTLTEDDAVFTQVSSQLALGPD
jgi:hypothetical protein